MPKLNVNFGEALKIVETTLSEVALAKADGKITIGELREMSFKILREVLSALDVWNVVAFVVGPKNIFVGTLVAAANDTAKVWLDALGLSDDPLKV